jgi:hypothetical protein
MLKANGSETLGQSFTTAKTPSCSAMERSLALRIARPVPIPDRVVCAEEHRKDADTRGTSRVLRDAKIRPPQYVAAVSQGDRKEDEQ